MAYVKGSKKKSKTKKKHIRKSGGPKETWPKHLWSSPTGYTLRPMPHKARFPKIHPVEDLPQPQSGIEGMKKRLSPTKKEIAATRTAAKIGGKISKSKGGKVSRKRGGKIMVGYKAGGKV